MTTSPPPALPRRAQPMAATWSEVARGGLATWLMFLTLLLSVLLAVQIISSLVTPDAGWSSWALMPVVLFYGAAIGGIVSAVVVPVMLPVAWLIARALQGVRTVAVHVGVYATLGAGVGLAAAVATKTDGGAWHTVMAAPLTYAWIGICAASVVFGWWRASRRARWALRRDRGAQIGSATPAL